MPRLFDTLYMTSLNVRSSTFAPAGVTGTFLERERERDLERDRGRFWNGALDICRC